MNESTFDLLNKELTLMAFNKSITKAANFTLLTFAALLSGHLTFGQGDNVKAKLPLVYESNLKSAALQAEYLKSLVDLEDYFIHTADSIVQVFRFDQSENKISVYEYSVTGNQREALHLKREDFLDQTGKIIHRKHNDSGVDEFFKYEYAADMTMISLTKYKSSKSSAHQELMAKVDFEYDQLGRKEKQFVYNSENKLEIMTSYSYDANNNIVHEEELNLGNGASYQDSNVRVAELYFEYDTTNNVVKESCEGCWAKAETIICKYEF